MLRNEPRHTLYDALTVFALILFLALAYDVAQGVTTRVRNYNLKEYSMTIVQRGNNTMVAYSDGWLCYHTEKSAVGCHRAIPKPTYKEIK